MVKTKVDQTKPETVEGPSFWPRSKGREFFIDNLLVRIHLIVEMI